MSLYAKIESAYVYIDGGILFLINIPMFILLSISQVNFVVMGICVITTAFLSSIAYYVLFLVFNKRTIGMKVFGLKVVSIGGSIPTKKEMLKRALYTLQIGIVFIKVHFGILDFEKWEREVLGTVTVEDVKE